MKRLIALLFFTLHFSLFTYLSAQTISTYAGNHVSGYNGNGGEATSAELDGPSGVLVDASGNLYIADEDNNVVREVNTSGVIMAFAGNGTLGSTGDGGLATAAELNRPTRLAIDVSGNVYIADQDNNVVRVVNTSGIISAFAGTGTPGYSGDGGAATAAELYDPIGLAFDASGNLYISDFSNNVIREVNTSGIINTVAGEYPGGGYSGDGGAATVAELDDPVGLAVDGSGNFYIGDRGNNVVRIVNTSGIINTFAGNNIAGYSGNGGLATAAELDSPRGICFDVSGNLFISEGNNNVIRVVNTSGIIDTYAGNHVAGYSGNGGLATAAEMDSPTDAAFDASGNLYIPDEFNNVIRKVTSVITNSPGTKETNEQLKIYPNPNSGIFTVALGHSELVSESQTIIEIFNILGEKVLTGTLRSAQDNNLINLAAQPSGVYLYRVISETGALIGEGKVIILK